MVSTSEKFADYLVRADKICEEDKGLYAFGMQQGLFILLNLATTLCIGLLFGMVWQVSLFTLAYLSLRSFAGGYHASTPQKCYLLSTAMTIAFLSLLKWSSSWSLVAFLILGSIATSTILLLAPLESKNKPLDSMERMVYRKRALAILCCQGGAATIFYVTNNAAAFAAMILSAAFVSGMLAIAKVSK